MMLHTALLIAWALIASGAPNDDPRPCIVHYKDSYFDLNPLRGKSDFVALTEIGDRNITMNVCGPVVGETWKIEEPNQVAGYFRGPHSDISVGKVNTAVSVIHGHPVLIFSNGSECPRPSDSASSGIRRSTLVRFICDQTVFGRGTPKLVAQLPADDDTACAFFVEWRTHVACPTHKPGGVWGPVVVFLAIILLTLVCYFTAAVCYNRMVLGLRGREQLPTFSLSGLFSLKDFLVARRRERDPSAPSWGSWRRDRNGFGGLPTEEEEAMLNGRFSIDDDDEGGARHSQALQDGTSRNLGNGGEGSGANEDTHAGRIRL